MEHTLKKRIRLVRDYVFYYLKKLIILISNRLFNWILNGNTISVGLVCLFIFLLIMTLSNDYIFQSFAAFFLIFFLFRIVIKIREEILYRTRKFNFSNLDRINYARAETLYNFGAIIAILSAIIINTGFLGEDYDSSLYFYAIFLTILFLFFAGLSIKRQNLKFSLLTIISSTIQGVIILLMLMLVLFGFVAVILSMITEGRNYENIKSIVDIFDPFLKGENIMVLSYYLEHSLTGIVGTMLFSTTLVILYIFIIPPVQLPIILRSFKIMNCIIGLSAMIIYFVANTYWDYVSHSLQGIDLITLERGLRGAAPNQEIKGIINYIKGFSISNITNVGYLLLLPYTLQTLIAYFIAEERYSKNKRKASEILLVLLKNNNCNIEFYQNKYLYCDGDPYELEIAQSIKDIQTSID